MGDHGKALPKPPGGGFPVGLLAVEIFRSHVLTHRWQGDRHCIKKAVLGGRKQNKRQGVM
jgi:hypothetical protein